MMFQNWFLPFAEKYPFSEQVWKYKVTKEEPVNDGQLKPGKHVLVEMEYVRDAVDPKGSVLSFLAAPGITYWVPKRHIKSVLPDPEPEWQYGDMVSVNGALFRFFGVKDDPPDVAQWFGLGSGAATDAELKKRGALRLVARGGKLVEGVTVA